MRIRSIKPEFWRSSDVSALEIEDRLLYIGLWSYVDDNGVGVDKLSAIAADLFADDLERDPRETFARVSRGLQKLSEAGRIVRYTVDDGDFLEIVNWSKHQRIDKPAKPRHPLSSNDHAVIRDTLATPSRHFPKESRLEQGNRGTGEQRNREKSVVTASGDRFPEWWTIWPKKIGKTAARTAWTKALRRTTPDEIITATRQLAPTVTPENSRYVPHPASWLNRGGWEDDINQMAHIDHAGKTLTAMTQIQEWEAEEHALES